ncbi:Hypothetical protein MSYG_3818 [Malassezia sympodialis ATCC 42132]|uniref:Uncharacterized protein n=1 Tax=Malassezia sympodialis (strain ATCC 42132) TaxID=1230383 RepID=A0A1M8AAL3_MALS4|nr:Hypothetical protein MSYG_3818 [Malassezia sympodialis ATCC 42132]
MDDPGGVRALLAKLREQQDRVAAPAAPVCGPPRRPWDRARLAQAAPAASLRTLPYALAVERIYELARDPAFAAQIQQLCDEQAALERTLAAQRAAIVGEREERLHGPMGARTQAQHARWAWDALQTWDDRIDAQQRHLEQLGVPCFYPTRETGAVETQRRLLRELHAACAAAPGAGRPPRSSGGP